MTDRRDNPSPVLHHEPPADVKNLYTMNAKHVLDPELLFSKVDAVKVWVWQDENGNKFVSYVKESVK